MVFQVSSSFRMFMLANALVQVLCCVPDIICVAQITLKCIDHALIVYNGGLLVFRGENLADYLRLKDRLYLDSNFCALILSILWLLCGSSLIEELIKFAG